MASKICMNPLCSETSTIRWRNGWRLRSGGFVNLCDKCGSAYDQLVFCDTFHLNESGWRECTSCGKRLHCGCIASKSSFELLDSGGVACISCMKSSNPSSIRSQVSQQSPHKVLGLPSKSSRVEKLSDFGKLFASVDNKIDDDTIDRDKLMQFGKEIEGPGQSSVLVTETSNTNGSFGQIKREQGTLPLEAGDMSFSNINQSPVGSLLIVKQDESKYPFLDKVAYESLARPCLNITLGTSNPGNVETCNNTPGTPNLTLPIPATVAATVAEGREQSKGPVAFPHGQRSRHILPKPPNTSPSTGSDSSKDVLPQLRVARPPGEGRGRNQLLPRYWPRITDQELQQISGDSNSTIVPLFEKVLSASDAGRIGRLVLPKACAEAYFPPISQPEGLPLKIQDAKGKDWIFQFRFWPNNNSRMYVLEGVTPCIQSMQLQAGDTVTFSRIDPEGKLVMGFRKATNSLSMQDTQISATSNGGIANETFITGVLENLHSISAYSGLLHSLKGGADPHLSTSFEQINPSETDTFWHKTEKHGGRLNKVLPLQSIFVPEKKRSRNLSSKSKRLLIDNEDALELKLTWEEAQDLLRPPPSVKPSIVVIEDHEFEEYEEPPVFGKRTIFTTRPSGGHDQWAQCDNCYQWRRLPVDALLPPRWTCSDNEWDPRRCSCSAPDEMSSKELEDLLRLTIDFKKRKAAGSRKSLLECEVSGLDALATVAVLGDGGNSMSPSISATTTKHPRHRPGCTCIVCIQPPSGKGPKHKPTCTCNVCMTVKRRFKTLMMRKKKRQSEREAETARKKLHVWGKDEAEVDSTLRCQLASDPENEVRQANTPESGQARTITEKAEIISNLSGSFKEDIGKGGIDLNCHPDREEDLHVGSARASMMNLLRMASLPLETYLKQHGLTSLVCEQQASSSSQVPPLGASESEGPPLDESYYTPVVHENAADESVFVPDHAQNDTL